MLVSTKIEGKSQYVNGGVEYAHFIVKVPVSGEVGGWFVDVRERSRFECSLFSLERKREGSGQGRFVRCLLIGWLDEMLRLFPFWCIPPFGLVWDHPKLRPCSPPCFVYTAVYCRPLLWTSMMMCRALMCLLSTSSCFLSYQVDPPLLTAHRTLRSVF